MAIAQSRATMATLATGLCLSVLCHPDLTRALANPEHATSLIVLVSATVSSIAGFAFSALAGPLLLFTGAENIHAVQVMLVASIALQAYSVAAFRKSISISDVRAPVLDGMLGLPLGIYLLLTTPPRIYLTAVGAFVVAYVLYVYCMKGATAQAPRWLRYTPAQLAVGALGGITGPVAAFPGALMTIWCGLHGWDKTRQRALYQPFILFMQIAAFAALSVVKPIDITLANLLVYVLPALIGAFVGQHGFNSLSTRQFNAIINGFLMFAGMMLLAKAML